MMVLSYLLQGVLIIAFFFSGMAKLTGAKMQVDTFEHLGLPQWFRLFTGVVAITGVVGLVIGFWNEGVLALAALWLACIMFGAILFHIRSKDKVSQMVPAFMLMTLALILLTLHFTEFLAILL